MRSVKSLSTHLFLLAAVSIAIDHLTHFQFGQKQAAFYRLDIPCCKRSTAQSDLHDLFELVSGLLEEQRLAVYGIQTFESLQDIIVVELLVIVHSHAVAAYTFGIFGVMTYDMLRIEVVRGLEGCTPTVQIDYQSLTTDINPVLKGSLSVVGMDIPEKIGQALVVVLIDVLSVGRELNREPVDQIQVGKYQFVE